MNMRSMYASRQWHTVRLLLLLLSAGCCLLLASCESWSGKSWSLSLKNPLKSTSTAVKAGERESSTWVAGKERDEPTADFTRQMIQARDLEKADNHDEARSIYQRLISSYPDRHEPYHRLGVVADRQKRYREAQALLSRAIRLRPKDAGLFNDLGYCMFLNGKLEKAEIALLKAVSLAPASARYRNNLGMVYGHQGRYEEALDEFRHAGSEADAYYNLAFVLAAKDEVEKAKDCFRAALKADPTYDRARGALASFQRYDEHPDAVMDNSAIVQNGIPWVPYVEDVQRDTAVQPASHVAPITSGRVGRFTRSDSQAR